MVPWRLRHGIWQIQACRKPSSRAETVPCLPWISSDCKQSILPRKRSTTLIRMPMTWLRRLSSRSTDQKTMRRMFNRTSKMPQWKMLLTPSRTTRCKQSDTETPCKLSKQGRRTTRTSKLSMSTTPRPGIWTVPTPGRLLKVAVTAPIWSSTGLTVSRGSLSARSELSRKASYQASPILRLLKIALHYNSMTKSGFECTIKNSMELI